jgi:hypothetical protein
VVAGPAVEVERRTVAMILVIDCSGSMGSEVPNSGGRIKMDYARGSALATARTLRPGDEFGAFGFTTDTIHNVPLTPVEEDPRAIERGLERIWYEPGGGTLIATTLKRVAAELKHTRAPVRHVVVISDGEVFDAADVGTIKQANDVKRGGATLSVVRIAGDADRMDLVAATERLASPGCYRFLRDPRELPRIVSLEVQRALAAAGRAPPPDGEPAAPGPAPDQQPPAAPEPPAAASQPQAPQPPATEAPPPQPEPEPLAALAVRAIGDSVLLAPRPADGWPPLLGITRTLARPDAHVLLVAGDEGLPVLAFANRGAGRVAAWTGDFARSGARWLEEPHFPARLAQWVSAILPPLPDAGPAPALAHVELRPPAPAAAEAAALAALTGAPLAPLASFTPPAALAQRVVSGRARELAAWGLLAIVALAVVEFLVRRRGW